MTLGPSRVAVVAMVGRNEVSRMIGEPVRFFFDYVDPASYVMSRILKDEGRDRDVTWVGFELRPPPMEPMDPTDEEWAAYQGRIGEYAEALGISMSTPNLVPWTRKAHELTLFAKDKDCSGSVTDALFQAHFARRLDIGRVDILVDLAVEQGLDRSETKAVLDVDRYTSNVESDRALGETLDLVGVPTLIHGEHRLEGLSSPTDVIAWLSKD